MLARRSGCRLSADCLIPILTKESSRGKHNLAERKVTCTRGINMATKKEPGAPRGPRLLIQPEQNLKVAQWLPVRLKVGVIE